jgi:hypothetical protein
MADVLTDCVVPQGAPAQCSHWYPRRDSTAGRADGIEMVRHTPAGRRPTNLLGGVEHLCSQRPISQRCSRFAREPHPSSCSGIHALLQLRRCPCSQVHRVPRSVLAVSALRRH